MSTTPLVIRADGNDGRATLTLNRPEKLNALNLAVFQELRAHLDSIASDEAIKCLILTGAGRSFCAGHDLGSIDLGDLGSSERYAAETIDALERLPQPTIARIHGHCFTGGLELALGCDLIISTDSAQFGDTHGQWGLVPVWGMTVRLPERVGRSQAKELMFTSRRIDGRTAAAMGLVDRCVGDNDLDTTVDGLVVEILANSPGTNRTAKKLLADRFERTREEALRHERALPYGLPLDATDRMGSGKA